MRLCQSYTSLTNDKFKSFLMTAFLDIVEPGSSNVGKLRLDISVQQILLNACL